jgi:hypothetical protein
MEGFTFVVVGNNTHDLDSACLMVYNKVKESLLVAGSPFETKR